MNDSPGDCQTRGVTEPQRDRGTRERDEGGVIIRYCFSRSENLPKDTVNILQNVFTNRKNCDIIESAKPIKYANGYNFLLGEVYLFSDWTKIEFDKMQIPLCSIGYTCFALIGLATIGVCVFVR